VSFVTAPQVSAGRLDPGVLVLKGYSIGGAEVSTVHANFIVNKGSAKAQDVLALAKHVQSTVLEKTGQFLEMEIRIIPYN
jgi:UDP-N-acetylmuramate dehydrogenase